MKQFKTHIKAAFSLALGVVLCSCLDLSPLDQLGDDTMWQNSGQYKLFANQFYGWPKDISNNVFDGPFSDLRSDLVTSSVKDVYSNGTNSIPATDANYTDNYKRIRRTNLLLAHAPSYSNPSDIAVYVAEAKFFRAYCYFDLVQLYGDVIIVKTPIDVDAPEMNAPRNPRGEVIDFIIQDLREAIPSLPLAGELAAGDEGRITRGGAQAFLARVALFEGTWQKYRSNAARGAELLDIAAKAAKQVIDSRQYELFKPATLATEAYRYMFILEDEKSNPANVNKSSNKEYIFARRHDQTISPIGKNITHTAQSNVWWITSKLADMYLVGTTGLPFDTGNNSNYATMTSEFTNRDNRMANTLMTPGKYFWSNDNPGCRINWTGDATDQAGAAYKNFNPRVNSGYHNHKWAAERQVTDNQEGYDYPIIRYAEVLLTYAEAVYERDGAISDGDLNLSLNLVRSRINPEMPRLSNALVSNNSLNMQTEIRRERTVELFCEGFRLQDLKRWKTAVTEMSMDLTGVKFISSPANEYYSQWNGATQVKAANGRLLLETNRKWKEQHYLYPLPADQTQMNPNLGQNPDWN